MLPPESGLGLEIGWVESSWHYYKGPKSPKRTFDVMDGQYDLEYTFKTFVTVLEKSDIISQAMPYFNRSNVTRHLIFIQWLSRSRFG
jgi:hypothetical protein